MEIFPGEPDMLRADNTRLRRLLKLSEEQARAAASDQATLTAAPASPVTMESRSAEKVRFFFDLFRCRTDIYAVRTGPVELHGVDPLGLDRRKGCHRCRPQPPDVSDIVLTRP